MTGAEERATIELTESVTTESLIQRLNANLPPGIRLHAAEEIPDAGSRDLLNSFDRAELCVMCACSPDTALKTVQQAAEALLARPQIPVEREREGRTKLVDIRPLICSLHADGILEERLTLTMILTLGTEGTAKPAEIVALLAETVPGLTLRRVHRVRLLVAEEDRPPQPPNSGGS